MKRRQLAVWLGITCLFLCGANRERSDYIRDLQSQAIEAGKSTVGYWGTQPDKYITWSSHSNRLIPVYSYGTKNEPNGISQSAYQSVNSPYRSEEALKRIYGRVPDQTLNPSAEYFDQTNLFDMQKAALKAGKKHIFLVVFDGMDWQTTQAAAIYLQQKVSYSEGRGDALHFQRYNAGGTSEFGFMVTSPHNEGSEVDVNLQSVKNPGGKIFGGYDPVRGGRFPWEPGGDIPYLITLPATDPTRQAHTDSSSSATSMTAGIKTYNNGVNVDANGVPVPTIAHLAQSEGYAVGALTSVPISHATPAAAYAHNVHRDDYQDLTRDLIGLPSISHPQERLSGLDVLIGSGWGAEIPKSNGQGENFVPGNQYLTDADKAAVNADNGGSYIIAERKAGISGHEGLQRAAKRAVKEKKRLLGFYGVAKTGHLPFATADGDFKPAPGQKKTEEYTDADISENVTLAEMTEAAIEVLSQNPKGFWLMVEAGDVDWANHDNNLDNSIGAVISGDRAVKVITDWVEKNSNWKESVVIVTADHGHYFFLDHPEELIDPKNRIGR
jgi:alkaline phosphatase